MTKHVKTAGIRSKATRSVYSTSRMAFSFRRSAERLSARASRVTNSKGEEHGMDRKSTDQSRSGWFVSLCLLDLFLDNGQQPLMLWIQDLRTSRLLPTSPPATYRGGVVGELEGLLSKYPKPERIELEHHLGLAFEAAAIENWARSRQIPVIFVPANYRGGSTR